VGVLNKVLETVAEIAVVAGLGYVAYRYLRHKYPWLFPGDEQPPVPTPPAPDVKIDDCCSWGYYLTHPVTCLFKNIYPWSDICKIQQPEPEPEPEQPPAPQCNWVNLTLQNCMADYWVPLFGKYWATSKVTPQKGAKICMADEPNARCPSGGYCSYIKQGETKIFATYGDNYAVTPEFCGNTAVSTKICISEV